MSCVKFISFSDVHISAMNPESRTGNFTQDILEKLQQVKKVGEKLDVDFFILAGDLFNLKAPMRNPHSLNSTLIELFSKFPAPIYATEGNHDLRFDSYETFSEQPLNVLYKSGVLKQLREEKLDINGVRILLRSFPFSERPDLSTRVLKDDNAVDASVAVLHLYATPGGGMLYKHQMFSYDEIAAMKDDIFVLGHYHIDQGIQEVSNTSGKKQLFINVGAVSRGALNEDNLDRTPKIAYVTINKDNGKTTFSAQGVRLKVRPAAEVFNLDKKTEETQQLKDAELFVERLRQETQAQSVQGEDSIEAEVNALQVDKEVLERTKHFLEEATLELRKVSAS